MATNKKSTLSTANSSSLARVTKQLGGTSKVLTINDGDSLGYDHGVTSIAISPNQQFVAAESLNTVVRIWVVTTVQLVERFRGHHNILYGKRLVSGSLDKMLKHWVVSDLDVVVQWLERKEVSCYQPLEVVSV